MNKNYKINYLSKDFASIREDLATYAKRYYSNSMADLSEASINSFFIEAAAYVGDVLSYYIDYQANESFLPTALESKNILNLAKGLGYKERKNSTTTGKVFLYILIPATNNNTPDFSKAPIIKKGTVLTTADRVNKYSISDDVVISENTVGANYVVARTNSLGVPTYFAVKIAATVISGVIAVDTYDVVGFTKFRKLFLNDPSAIEIISIVDSDNNEYYEVSNLAQNIIYKAFKNNDTETNGSVKSILRTVPAIRRFVFDFEDGVPYVLFGAKEYNLEKDLSINPIAEPSKFIINKYNNDFLQDSYFEPNSLLNGDNFGIGPSDTTLTITYRQNNTEGNNAEAGTLTTVGELLYEFIPGVNLDTETESTILGSVQVVNEESIIGENTVLTNSEIKNLAGSIFQSQNRAVTAKDFEALSYMMPAKYGSIKKCRAERDPKSLKNNVNLYVVCASDFNQLTSTNSKIKENLKFWLSQYKMITDSVDILDAKIINFSIEYKILVDPNFDKIEVKNNVDNQLRFIYSFPPEIGQNFDKLSVYREIQKIKGILDIIDVKVFNKTSVGYSQTSFNVEQNTSEDGNTILIPRNAIYEIRFPTTDIIGKVI